MATPRNLRRPKAMATAATAGQRVRVIGQVLAAAVPAPVATVVTARQRRAAI